jgi:ferredoxin-NADP reductase
VAEQLSAQLVQAEAVGAETRLLRFAFPDGVQFGFVGGKYIIINSGKVLPDGKICKRAYSILSSDSDQTGFEIAVRRIGMGSNFLHDLPLHSELQFSGPWGKFVAMNGQEEESTWILATDTGITAALGLIQAEALKPKLARTELCWWVQPGSYFLPESYVRERIPSACGSFRVEQAPWIGDPDRVRAAHGLLAERARRGEPSRVYLCGDGAAILPLSEALVADGMPQDHIHVETFFNHPKRKSV